MSWYIAVLMKLFPGTGRRDLLNSEYFWAKNIIDRPVIPKTTTMGWREQKKQQNKNKFTT